jgi:formate dehydrogenase maturation protein FdhE
MPLVVVSWNKCPNCETEGAVRVNYNERRDYAEIKVHKCNKCKYHAGMKEISKLIEKL